MADWRAGPLRIVPAGSADPLADAGPETDAPVSTQPMEFRLPS
jgi:hypothetical protein